MSKILIMTTVGSEQEAVEIAEALVHQRLAACVSYSMRFHSVYRWEGEVCSDQEVLMLVKSTKEREDEVIELIEKLHQYDVPEILSLEINRGSAKYLKWIEEVVK